VRLFLTAYTASKAPRHHPEGTTPLVDKQLH
jgi:hypothetical protein